MTPAETYRKLAAEFEAKARAERNIDLRIQYQDMAKSYLRLAQDAESERPDHEYGKTLSV